MATLSSLISSRRNSGAGVVGSISGGLKEKLKETIDPRRLINQKGLLPALFPGLRAYQSKNISSLQDTQQNLSYTNNPLLESINLNSVVAAKNFVTLPMIAWNLNVTNRNLIKLLKLEGGKTSERADRRFFLSAKERNAAYLAQIRASKNKKPTEITQSLKPKSGFIVTAALLTLAGAILYKLEILSTETLKNAVDGVLTALTGSTPALAAINRKVGMESGVLEELSSIKFSDLNEEQKTRFLESQFKSEGAKPGTLPYDLNNPGAMVYSDWQKEFGGEKGRTVTGPDGVTRTFAKFPSMEKGKQAQRALWERKYGNMPLDQALRTWVSPGTSPEAQSQFNAYAERSLQAIRGDTGGLKTRISSEYGMRMDPFTKVLKMHKGIDIAAPANSPVVATKSGTISKVDFEANGYGKYIDIEHSDGYKTRYAHLNNILVSVGDQVNQGQTIGAVGSTGRSTGPHLHYEVHKDGVIVNPKTASLQQISPVTNGPAISIASADVIRSENKKGGSSVVIVDNTVITNQSQRQTIASSSFDPFTILMDLNSSYNQ
jgi:murein DD-endopeptidase MepM/ murein hydrolase activator NlpD